MMVGESQAFYSILEQKVAKWGREDENIRAAIVVGSRARLERPADDWSDLDIILFTTKPNEYLNRLDWIEAFAPVWVSVTQHTVSGDPERLIVFEGGWQTDFVFNDSAVLSQIPQIIASGNIPDIIRRGVRVLVDKDNSLAQLPPPSPVPLPPPPSAKEFSAFAEGFWFQVIYASKQLCRGELARYKGCEEGLRGRLVQLIEWHARATRGADTWHGARFLESWVEPAIYTKFTQSYTPLETQACRTALQTLVELFCELTKETAAVLNYPNPVAKTQALFNYIRSLG